MTYNELCQAQCQACKFMTGNAYVHHVAQHIKWILHDFLQNN